MAQTGNRPNIVRRATPRDSVDDRLVTLEDDRQNLMKRVGILEALTPDNCCETPWMRRSQEILTGQLVPQNSVTGIDFDTGGTTFSDTATLFFAASSTDGIQVLVDGMIAVTAEFDNAEGFDATIWSSVNDSLAAGGHYVSHQNSAAFTFTKTRPTMFHRWEAGTVIRLDILQASVVSLTMQGVYLEVAYVGSITGPDPFDGNPDW